MQAGRVLSFPPFHLDVDKEQLRRDDTVIPLRPKAFAVLRYLAEHTDRLVIREEVVQAVWKDTKVSEGVLRGCLREIRQALGDSVEAPRFIETVGRQGWRFIAPLNTTPPVQSSRFQVQSSPQPPILHTQHLAPESVHQEPEPVDLPPLETVSFPAAINGAQSTDCASDASPVEIQPPSEALSDAAQAESRAAPLITDVQPWKIPSPLQSVNKTRRWQIATAVLGLLLFGGIVAMLQFFPFTGFREEPTLPLPDKPSLVVLPFANLSGDPEQDYFSDGITADLTSDLSQVPDLFVIARNSAFTYKGKAIKTQQIGQELGVRYVVEGSVSKSSDQVRIRVQLIDATTGFHVWSERYERPLKDLFLVQDEIGRKILTTLKLQLSLWLQGWQVRKRTSNMEAYDAYLRGMEHILRNTQEESAQARKMFEKAMELDPQYVWAYLGIGQTYFTDWIRGWSQDPQTLEQAFVLAQQAAAINDDLPRVHTFLSWIYLWKRQPEQALIEIKKATDLDPNNADSYARQAEVLNVLGKGEEARQSIERAMRLNPHYPPWYLFELGWAYTLLWRYDEVVATLKTFLRHEPNHQSAHIFLVTCYLRQWAHQLNQDPQALELAFAMAQRAVTLGSSNPWAHRALGAVYLWKKQYEQAIAEFKQALILEPIMADTYAVLAEAFARAGIRQEAMNAVEQAIHLGPPPIEEVYWSTIGVVYALGERNEEAIVSLQQSLTQYPHSFWARLQLAAVYAELGREEKARGEAAELLRINPHFSLEVYRQRVPLKDPVVLKRHIAALRKAGLT